MFTLGFFGPIGPMQMIIIGVILLLIFGRRLPEVSRNIGKGIVEFKKGLSGAEDDIKKGIDQPGQQAPPPPPPPQVSQNNPQPGNSEYNNGPQGQNYQAPAQQPPQQQQPSESQGHSPY